MPHICHVDQWLRSSGFILLSTGTLIGSSISVSDPTTAWNAVGYSSVMDALHDQQGPASGDIVGDSLHPAFYAQFDGTYLYYRVRLGDTRTQGGGGGTPTFSGVFWVGIDGNRDGALDMFIGVNNQGNNARLQFNDAGSGKNNSPGASRIGNAASSMAQVRGQNFHYARVSNTLQPGVTDTDLNSDGTDAFLSFRVPFWGAPESATLQGAMMQLAGIAVTADTRFSYVVATSTQSNTINQDFGGVNDKTFNPSLTYLESGAISYAVNLEGLADPPPVPVSEPATVATVLTALGVLLFKAFKNRTAVRPPSELWQVR